MVTRRRSNVPDTLSLLSRTSTTQYLPMIGATSSEDITVAVVFLPKVLSNHLLGESVGKEKMLFIAQSNV